MDVFACGFNGFQQISKFGLKKASAEIKEPITFYDRPEKIETYTNKSEPPHCLITWSNLHITQHDARESRSDGTPRDKAVAATWKQTIFQTEKGTYFTLDNKIGSEDCKHDVELNTPVTDVIGNETGFYCIHDGGKLSRMALKSKSPSSESTSGTDGASHVALLQNVFTSSVVTSISCGKEHIVFLTSEGHVFTFGLGSRGQLGHDSVEEEKTARQVECLDGLHVVGAAAGGWHSAAITESGDLFTWGWNESGQLGHNPTKPKPVTCIQDVNTHSVIDKASGIDVHIETLKHSQPSIPTKSISTKQNIHQIFSGDKNIEVTNLERVCEAGEVHRADVDKSHEYGEVGSGEILLQESQECETVHEDHAVGGAPDVIGQRLTLVTSPLLVTSLPEDYTAVRVSCGSRHTAVIIEDGKLYTTGWNKYGQLCQGHTVSSDVFVPVPLRTKVKDVTCGCWNTVIFAEQEER